MKYWKHILVGAGLLAIGGIAYGQVVSQPAPVVESLGAATLTITPGATIDTALANPTQIQWTQPTTDQGWADDDKQESFDLKSTDVLQQMLIEQKAGLAQATSSMDIYINCPDCVTYNLQKANPDWSAQQITDEFNREYAQYEWLVEKISQSIIRIEHELDLRARGVVVPDKQNKAGTPTKTSDLQKVVPNMIRHIND